MIGGGITNGTMALFGVSPDEILAQNRQLVYDKRNQELEKLRADRPPEGSRVSIAQYHAELLKEQHAEPEAEEESSSPTIKPSAVAINVSSSNPSSPTMQGHSTPNVVI